MNIPRDILETAKIYDYLHSRNIVKQYRRVKELIKMGIFGGADFKERQPKGSNNRSFRINRKYRALGYIDDEGDLIIFKIDGHQ